MMPATITEHEVRVFGDKLAALGEALSDHEQTLLYEILMRAAAEDDVEGHGMIQSGELAVTWSRILEQVRRVASQMSASSDRAMQRSMQRPYINHQS